MNPNVLTTAGSVSCAQQGTVNLSASTPVLKVSGAAVLVVSDLSSASITGCTTVADASKGLVTCATTTPPSSGAASLLLVGGEPALLESAAGMTTGATGAGTPATYSTGSAGQSLLVTT